MIAITVSTNYDDILQYVLPNNQPFFDKWIIVTHKDDDKTIRLVNKYNYDNVKLIFFDFYAHGKRFNKGGAIQFAQKTIPSSYEGAVLLLDSDILLPFDFKNIISNMNINDNTLYGVNNRFDYYSYDNLLKNKHDFLYPGYGFHGFFHLYKFTPHLLYLDSFNCAQCDIDFINLFPSKIQIQNLNVKHLGKSAVNWDKRNKTDFIH